MFYKEYFQTNAINTIIFKKKIQPQDTNRMSYRAP